MKCRFLFFYGILCRPCEPRSSDRVSWAVYFFSGAILAMPALCCFVCLQRIDLREKEPKRTFRSWPCFERSSTNRCRRSKNTDLLPGTARILLQESAIMILLMHEGNFALPDVCSLGFPKFKTPSLQAPTSFDSRQKTSENRLARHRWNELRGSEGRGVWLANGTTCSGRKETRLQQRSGGEGGSNLAILSFCQVPILFSVIHAVVLPWTKWIKWLKWGE